MNALAASMVPVDDEVGDEYALHVLGLRCRRELCREVGEQRVSVSRYASSFR